MYEERLSSSPLARQVWRAEGDQDGVFTDPATEFWGVAFTREPDGRRSAVVYGPNVESREMIYVAGHVHWGVDFQAHVFWPGLEKVALLGEFRCLPVENERFEIGGTWCRIPEYEQIEAMIDELVAAEIIVAEPAVGDALAGGDPDVSDRTLRRRFRETTGLGRKQIEQIARARHAFALLQQGHRLAEAAYEAGYADQAHMTRSLGLLAGQTPAGILAGSR